MKITKVINQKAQKVGILVALRIYTCQQEAFKQNSSSGTIRLFNLTKKNKFANFLCFFNVRNSYNVTL